MEDHIKKVKNLLKELIVQRDFDKVFNYLTEISKKEKDDDLTNELTLLKRRFYDLKDNPDKSLVEYNRVTNALIMFIDSAAQELGNNFISAIPKSSPNSEVSNLITNYKVAVWHYIEVLFQIGVEKIYLYGSGFPSHYDSPYTLVIPNRNETYGLSIERQKVYIPLNMIRTGIENHAHIDLNYEEFIKELNYELRASKSQEDKYVISRIIGSFQSYREHWLPTLGIIASEIFTMTSKLDKLKLFGEELFLSKEYNDYKESMYLFGTVDYQEVGNLIKESRNHLQKLLSWIKRKNPMEGKGLTIVDKRAYINSEKRNESFSELLKVNNSFNPFLLDLREYRKKSTLDVLDRIQIRLT